MTVNYQIGDVIQVCSDIGGGYLLIAARIMRIRPQHNEFLVMLSNGDLAYVHMEYKP